MALRIVDGALHKRKSRKRSVGSFPGGVRPVDCDRLDLARREAALSGDKIECARPRSDVRCYENLSRISASVDNRRSRAHGSDRQRGQRIEIASADQIPAQSRPTGTRIYGLIDLCASEVRGIGRTGVGYQRRHKVEVVRWT